MKFYHQKITYFSLRLFALALLFSACSDGSEENPEEIIRAKLTAHEWKGERFDTQIGVSPALVLVVLGLSQNDLQFGESIPLLGVKFESDGTFTGTDVSGEDVSGLWSLAEGGQRLRLTGFDLGVPEDFIPPALLAIIPEGTDLSSILPSEYDIVELTDTKLTLGSNTSTEISQVTETGIPINVTISPQLSIYLIQ